MLTQKKATKHYHLYSLFIIQILVATIPLSAPMTQEDIALDDAISENNIDNVRIAIAKGANINTPLYGTDLGVNLTAIQLTAYLGHSNILEIIASQKSADLNQLAYNQRSLLHLVSLLHIDSSTIQKLILLEAPIGLRDHENKTPLDYLIKNFGIFGKKDVGNSAEMIIFANPNPHEIDNALSFCNPQNRSNLVRQYGENSRNRLACTIFCRSPLANRIPVEIQKYITSYLAAPWEAKLLPIRTKNISNRNKRLELN